MGRGSAWLDTGSATNLFNASQYIAAIEERQGLKIACIEEIAYQNRWISKKQVLEKNDMSPSKFHSLCVVLRTKWF